MTLLRPMVVVAVIVVGIAMPAGGAARTESDMPYRLGLPMVARDEPSGPSVPYAFVVGDAVARCDPAANRWVFSGRFYDAFDRSAYVFPDALTIVLAEHAGPGVLHTRPDILVAQDGTFEAELLVSTPGEYTLTLQSIVVPEFHYLVEVPVTGQQAFGYEYGAGCSEKRW